MSAQRTRRERRNQKLQDILKPTRIRSQQNPDKNQLANLLRSALKASKFFVRNRIFVEARASRNSTVDISGFQYNFTGCWLVKRSNKRNGGKLFAYKLNSFEGTKNTGKVNENAGKVRKYWIKVGQDCVLTRNYDACIENYVPKYHDKTLELFYHAYNKQISYDVQHRMLLAQLGLILLVMWLVQFWPNVETSLALLIPNYTHYRMVTL